MPTVIRKGPYRIFFYSGDRDEPPHIHLERDESEAKFWLDPVRHARSHGFGSKELATIEKTVTEEQQYLLNCWNEFFNA